MTASLNKLTPVREREFLYSVAKEDKEPRAAAIKFAARVEGWKPGQMASPCVRMCKPVTDALPRIRQRTVTQRVGSCKFSLLYIDIVTIHMYV